MPVDGKKTFIALLSLATIHSQVGKIAISCFCYYHCCCCCKELFCRKQKIENKMLFKNCCFERRGRCHILARMFWPETTIRFDAKYLQTTFAKAGYEWTISSTTSLQQKEMKAATVQMISCCVYDRPKKLCSTRMATCHTRLTVGSIRFFILLLLKSSTNIGCSVRTFSFRCPIFCQSLIR